VLLLLVAAFVIGYLQGTIRRLLGIAAVLFSFVLAAQIRDPFGDFLANNWTQFPPAYSHMIAFLLTFFAAWIALSLLIQGFYERSPILPRWRHADPIIGGILGILQAGLLIGIGVVILDTYFLGVGKEVHPNELPFLRELAHAIDVSQTAKFYRETAIPTFFLLIGLFFPEDIRAPYAR
jgi:uncharacterized membrane protein required for colicin V production